MTLQVDQIRFSYPKRPPVVEDVSLQVAPGRVTVIVGPNGSGKSTLIRLLLGALRPQDGTIRLGTRDVHRLRPRERARSIAYIAQRPDAAFAYPVRQVVSLGRLALGRPASEDDRAVTAALERVGMAEFADRPLTELSVGQQQRVAIARALAQLDQPGTDHPRALLADEPIAALDPLHALSTLRLFGELASDGIAVVVVLHDLLSAVRHADDAVVMQAGRVAASGKASGVLTPKVLGPVFGMGFDMPMEGVLIPTV
jgi:iron complex transport system ATP-binding protein